MATDLICVGCMANDPGTISTPPHTTTTTPQPQLPQPPPPRGPRRRRHVPQLPPCTAAVAMYCSRRHVSQQPPPPRGPRTTPQAAHDNAGGEPPPLRLLRRQTGLSRSLRFVPPPGPPSGLVTGPLPAQTTRRRCRQWRRGHPWPCRCATPRPGRCCSLLVGRSCLGGCRGQRRCTGGLACH